MVFVDQYIFGFYYLKGFFAILLRGLLLVILTRCMRYWDDLSVTQLLVRSMRHLKKHRLAELSVLAFNSKSKDCAKHVCV